MNNKIRSMAFSPREEEMIQDIKNHTGLKNPSAVVHYAIIELHRTLFPAYRQPVATGTPAELEKKARAKVDMKEMEKKAKEEKILEARVKSCKEDFLGEYRPAEGLCYFNVYAMDKSDDHEDNIDIYSCFPHIAENQVFMPTREAVLKNRKDLVKKLKLEV